MRPRVKIIIKTMTKAIHNCTTTVPLPLDNNETLETKVGNAKNRHEVLQSMFKAATTLKPTHNIQIPLAISTATTT